jgi:tRNA dimethylallyltransferase
LFIIITGATGTGKSAVAVALAKKMNAEIISADSMQVYRGMDIGTNKISSGEMAGIRHHLIDVAGPEKDFSAAQFKREAERAMDGIKSRGKMPIICGGTGLYIHAVIRGIMKAEEPTEEIRERIRGELESRGLEYLVSVLREKDPEAAAAMDIRNSRRVTRALEVMEANGVKFSELKTGAKDTVYKDSYKMFVLELPRDELNRRIDLRADKMLEKGLENEVKSLIEGGKVRPNSTSMQAIGYKELAGFNTAHGMTEYGFKSGYNLTEVVDEIKQATRGYAKRQVTWFKKYKEAVHINVNGKSVDDIIEIISQKLEVKSQK